MGPEFYDAIIGVNLYFQGFGDWLIAPMQIITELGSEDIYAMILPVLLWVVDYGLGLRVGLMVSLSGSINQIFKAALHQPRPYWHDANVQNLAGPETGFGIPSGHSQISLSAYGLLAVMAKGGWKTVSWVVIILIGISRMVLGVHFITDTVLGWVIGGLLLWAFLKYEDQVKEWFLDKQTSQQISLIFGFSLVLIFISVGVQAANADFVIPETWVKNAAVSHPDEPLIPFSPSKTITPAATLFGLVAGALWLHPRGGFNAKGPLGQKAVRFIVGIIGVLVFWMGLGEVFPREEDFISYALRFVRYGLTGFWISGMAPFLFVKWGLAEPKD